MSTVLPNAFLKRMRPEDRAKLGKAGMTAEEAEAAFVARTESELQIQIKTMLNRNGIKVVRSRMDKRTTTEKGTPDLIFAVNGQPIAWEVKMPGKKPTAEQVETMRDMTANGWRCSVVESYDQALAIYTALTTDRPTPDPR